MRRPGADLLQALACVVRRGWIPASVNSEVAGLVPRRRQRDSCGRWFGWRRPELLPVGIAAHVTIVVTAAGGGRRTRCRRYFRCRRFVAPACDLRAGSSGSGSGSGRGSRKRRGCVLVARKAFQGSVYVALFRTNVPRVGVTYIATSCSDASRAQLCLAVDGKAAVLVAAHRAVVECRPDDAVAPLARRGGGWRACAGRRGRCCH